MISFCRKTKALSGFFFCCGQCDFYLDSFCFLFFEICQLLLRSHEFPYFLHGRENHFLSPHLSTKSTAVCQLGCRQGYISEGHLVFKCTSWDYYLQVNCSRVAQQMQHLFHPQHSITLIPNNDFVKLIRCSACHIRIKELFVFLCTQCDFYIDIGCSSWEATTKSKHHDHPLAYFDKMFNEDVEDVLCAVCNTLCHADLLRCVDCNFNIHPGCLSLPFVVDYYDHGIPSLSIVLHSKKKMIRVDFTTAMFVKKEEIHTMLFINVKDVLRSLLILNVFYLRYAPIKNF